MTHIVEVQHTSATPVIESSAATVALRQFTLDLREARRAAGEPSYAALVESMGRQSSKATISRVLNGARPSWRFTHLFLTACGVDEAAITETWRTKWIELQGALKPLGLREPDEMTGVGGAECSICGGWATDTVRHENYHRQRGDSFPPRNAVN